VWSFLKLTIEKTGAVRSEKMKSDGLPSANNKCLNNLIFLVYRLIYDTYIYEFNKYKYNSNPLLRYKQKIYETLYLDFYKARMRGMEAEESFLLYWKKCHFFFKIKNSSIDIRIN